MEDAVKQALKQFFAEIDFNLVTIREFVDRRLQEMLKGDTDVQSLMTQRQATANELAFCTRELEVLGPELLKKKIDPLKARLIGLDARIAVAKQASTGLNGSTDEIVEAVAEELRRAARLMDDTSTPAFRSVVSTLTRTVIDLDKRTAEVEMRVPLAFLADLKAANLGRCLGSPPLPICRTQTPIEDAVILGKLRCEERKQDRKPCLACVRHAA